MAKPANKGGDSLGIGALDTARKMLQPKKTSAKAKLLAARYNVTPENAQDMLDAGLRPCAGCNQWLYKVRNSRCPACTKPLTLILKSQKETR